MSSPEKLPRTSPISCGTIRGIPEAIVEERGLKQVTDESAIESAVDQVIAANPDKVEEVKAKPKLAGWFVRASHESNGWKSESAGRERDS